MIGHKNKIIFLIASIVLLQSSFMNAMQRPFDAQNTLEEFVRIKSIGGTPNYNDYSSDQLKTLISLAWRTLDPEQAQLITTLATKLNSNPYFTWEYLNDVRKELFAEVQKRNIVIPGIQPIPVPGIVPIKPAVPVPAAPISPAKIYLINTNEIRDIVIGLVPINANTSLIQLRSVDQSKPSISEVFGGETCPILALHNAMSVLLYANTGNLDLLKNINNEEIVKQFLMKLGTCRRDWNRLTTQEVEMLFLAGVPQNIVQNISVLDSVIEFGNPQVGQKFHARNSEILKDIKDGLMRENFAYSLVFGDEEFIQLKLKPGITMHYVAFSIIKNANQIQYIIIDSLGNQSHLTGMRRAQLDYLIDLLTQGFSYNRLQAYLKYLNTDAKKEKEAQEQEYLQQLIKIYGIQGQP